MRLAMDAAAIGRGLGAEVPPMTLWAGPGAPSVVQVETAERPMLVSMMLAGRIGADTGAIRVDDRTDPVALRQHTALVDTPVVAEPVAGVSLAGVVAEELVFADRPAGRRAVRAFLEQHELLRFARVPMRALPPNDRVRLLCELALLRPGVRAIILTSPERHGGEPDGWYESLEAIAFRGITVVIVTDAVTAERLLDLGARDATAGPDAAPSEEVA
ncbi:hypothetical protein QMG83_00885 [Salinibacterium sp. G-O1]|uniref:hypothetical protein n=1 Tax=Salinibacterium sp. G-O1 TaxID=3046208 RepID=UPI0024B93E56|nr:hypothetical protein [Salinibacterium sp. G-O1]MDJ0333770.1 hypothetical protein [Salinibacterium sp. G-O1]